jgi:hypothetical protein
MKSAKHLFVAVMGAWMGLAGVEHGVGEILQGNAAPAGVMILSWPDSAFFQSLGGEPALTVLPNMLVTGLLAVFFSLLYAGWAIWGSQHRHHGWGLVLLAVLMLLFGGGIFPPILGMLIGAAALGRRRVADRHPVSGMRRLLGRAWPWIFGACCLAWLALFPGSTALSYFFGIDQEGITLALIAAAFTLLLAAYLSSLEYDRLTSARGRQPA